MKKHTLSVLALSLMLTFSCQNDDDSNLSQTPTDPVTEVIDTTVDFQYKSTIQVGGEASSEISAYDKVSKKLFITNAESNVISVYNIENINNPIQESDISLSSYGAPNSVAVYDGKLAIAVEATVKQNPGKILLYNTSNLSLLNQYTVGALPDMVTFSKDGNLIL